MRDPRSKGKEGVVLYHTSLTHPSLIFSFILQFKKVVTRNSMFYTNDSYQIASQYRSHSSYTPLCYVCSCVSTNCFTQMVSSSISEFLFPTVPEWQYQDATLRRTIILISPSVLFHYNLPGQHIQFITSFPVQKGSFKIMYTLQTSFANMNHEHNIMFQSQAQMTKYFTAISN